MLVAIVLWNIFGFFIFLALGALAEAAVNCGISLSEILEPYFFYEYIGMNMFGAWLCAIIVNLACPVLTIFLWISKLFFIGRD